MGKFILKLLNVEIPIYLIGDKNNKSDFAETRKSLIFQGLNQKPLWK
jgi:hypothetical protein